MTLLKLHKRIIDGRDWTPKQVIPKFDKNGLKGEDYILTFKNSSRCYNNIVLQYRRG